MFFKWLKGYMPRSLYGRAALILILPIVTIQLVVSVVFIQRHFEDVTRQMTNGVLLELRYLLAQVEAAPDMQAALAQVAPMADPLGMELLAGTTPVAAVDRRLFYDLSGRVVIASLRGGLNGVRGIDLASNDKQVRLALSTAQGPLEVRFPRNRVSASNPHQLLVLMIFIGLLMTLIAFIFLRNQLRPIKRLAVAAEAFGKGRLTKYAPSGATEVRAAGSAFLDMRNRIERQIEQRTMMLSGVSHDLRTPLTRLKLGLSMLEPDDDTRAMERDVEEMEALLDGFLDFARGDAGDELVRADPLALVREVVENSVRAGREVQLVSAEGAGQMLLRATALARALDNLIGNAVRYGSRAEVSVALTEKALRVSVEDDGPGIAPEQRDEALKPFARLEPARNQNRGSGVGLGLSIAVDIARAHGGTLRLGESDTLGGLRADLVLPRLHGGRS